MRALDYLPALIALLAALAAVLGAPKWDPKKRGIRRLTRAGRVTVIVATAAFIASTGLTWRSHRAAAFEARQRARVTSLAHTELRLALIRMTWPFHDVFDDFPNYPEHLVPAKALDRDIRSKVATMNSYAPSAYGGSSTGEMDYSYAPSAEQGERTWCDVFSEAAADGAKRIDRTLQIYSIYLDPDILDLLSDLQTCEFLNSRLLTTIHPAPFRFEFVDPREVEGRGDMWGYEHFWRIIDELDTRLEKNDARLRRHM